MATLEENIEKIRSTAVLGTDVREAIGEALTQVDSPVQNSISSAITQLSAEILDAKAAAATLLNQYNAAIDQRISALEVTIEDRTLYVTANDLGDGDYRLDVINAE